MTIETPVKRRINFSQTGLLSSYYLRLGAETSSLPGARG
jgi:hypothetical protein